MFARILTERKNEQGLFRAAMKVHSSAPALRSLSCEFVPGVGINLYAPWDEPAWAAGLGSGAEEAVWPLPSLGDFSRPGRSEPEVDEEITPIAEFVPGLGAQFRYPHRVSTKTLALTHCALNILRQAGAAGAVHILLDDWSEERPVEDLRHSHPI